jgi:hypothetical protein
MAWVGATFYPIKYPNGGGTYNITISAQYADSFAWKNIKANTPAKSFKTGATSTQTFTDNDTLLYEITPENKTSGCLGNTDTVQIIVGEQNPVIDPIIAWQQQGSTLPACYPTGSSNAPNEYYIILDVKNIALNTKVAVKYQIDNGSELPYNFTYTGVQEFITIDLKTLTVGSHTIKINRYKIGTVYNFTSEVTITVKPKISIIDVE